MMASMKQLFCTFPGQHNLSSKKYQSNMESECLSFYLALGGQTSSYSSTTRDSAVINNFQNNLALLFLFSTDRTHGTGSITSLLKMEILKFASANNKRRDDTNRM